MKTARGQRESQAREETQGLFYLAPRPCRQLFIQQGGSFTAGHLGFCRTKDTAKTQRGHSEAITPTITFRPRLMDEMLRTTVVQSL